jgi:serine/threonine protein kinase
LFISSSRHICDGMSYLEEKGIVHRDLAASNVLISKDSVAKVSDFGLAKKIMDDTRNGVRIRIKWTAPEAIKERVTLLFYSFLNRIGSNSN